MLIHATLLINEMKVNVLEPKSIKKYIIEIYNLERKYGHATISDIAELLNVTVSSASKMVAKLKKQGFVNFQPYRTVTLTKKGLEIGNQLEYTNKTLVEFYKYIGIEEKKITQEVKEIEVYINPEVVTKIKSFLETKVKNA
ncbi:DtxR family iron (metal) dependent repressor [Cytobacillus oceanisediminis]|jgi:Mn-dependent DtxR family transcriptional regulator|uniref:DtxR family iron (Metal) dependent repressor n=1 Tax=Cytobacillus oceanisediminis TaxID=665099 RepID=A0A2V3A518_9BACI|nr:DtxR family iron (metal) dependent repressor [Cytobacillus oceanisediminis]